MDGDAASLAHRIRLALRKVDRMAEQGFGTDQAIMGVDVGIVLGLRVKLAGISDLVHDFQTDASGCGDRGIRGRALPAISICSGVEVMAKRGVMATWLRPLPCQSAITCLVSS